MRSTACHSSRQCVCCQSGSHTTLASRRIKMDRHFDDLEEVYFTTRRQNAHTLAAGDCDV